MSCAPEWEKQLEMKLMMGWMSIQEAVALMKGVLSTVESNWLFPRVPRKRLNVSAFGSNLFLSAHVINLFQVTILVCQWEYCALFSVNPRSTLPRLFVEHSKKPMTVYLSNAILISLFFRELSLQCPCHESRHFKVILRR